jgi:hypothetical protein
MSNIKNQNRYTGIDRRAGRVEISAVKSTLAAPFKTGGRHAAITTSLYNFHSYKNWADKMKGSWEEKK